jgi:hypothetical protein
MHERAPSADGIHIYSRLHGHRRSTASAALLAKRICQYVQRQKPTAQRRNSHAGEPFSALQCNSKRRLDGRFNNRVMLLKKPQVQLRSESSYLSKLPLICQRLVQAFLSPENNAASHKLHRMQTSNMQLLAVDSGTVAAHGLLRVSAQRKRKLYSFCSQSLK